MLRQHYGRNQKIRTPGGSGENSPTGQIFLEYIIIVGSIVLVLFAMSTLIRRGTQGMIKVVADQLGNQAGAEQRFDRGFLENSYSTTRTTSSRNKTEFLGNIIYTFSDTTTTNTAVLIDMGFTEDN